MSFRRRSALVPHQAYCDRCRRSFVTDRALEQHIGASPRHHICPGCNIDYITYNEMEECGCGDSEEEPVTSDVYYEPGSAGTLSDDGGGGDEPSYNTSTPANHFTDTFCSVPEAWNDGTSTSGSYSSSVRRVQELSWRDFVEETGYDWQTFAFEAADAGPSYSTDEYSSDEIPSGSHSESSHDEERHGVQSPVTGATVTPYCQRCNRQFSTINGLHQHNRMSLRHPWYCLECRIDFDRETDLQRHIAAVHEGNPQAGNVAQPSTATSSGAPAGAWIGELTANLVGLRRTSGAPEADTSTSTIRVVNRYIPHAHLPSDSPSIWPHTTRPHSQFRGFSPEAVSAEPMNAQASGNGQSTLAINCPLCLDTVTALTSTLCGHVFCKECITAAVQHKPECPVCRAYTHIRGLHPVFLNVISS